MNMLGVEIYSESLGLLNEFDNIIILRTFSKAYGMAGLRIGYAISNKNIIGYLNRVRGPFNTDAGAQLAAIAALKSGVYKKEYQSNNQGKEYCTQLLKKWD